MRLKGLPRRSYVASILIATCVLMWNTAWPRVSADRFISRLSVTQDSGGQVSAKFYPRHATIHATIPCDDWLSVKQIDLSKVPLYGEEKFGLKEGYAVLLTVGEREFDLQDTQYLPFDAMRRFFSPKKRFVKIWKVEIGARLPGVVPAEVYDPRRGRERWDIESILDLPYGRWHADTIRCKELGGYLKVAVRPGTPTASASPGFDGAPIHGYVFIPSRVVRLEWVPPKREEN